MMSSSQARCDVHVWAPFNDKAITPLPPGMSSDHGHDARTVLSAQFRFTVSV